MTFGALMGAEKNERQAAHCTFLSFQLSGCVIIGMKRSVVLPHAGHSSSGSCFFIEPSFSTYFVSILPTVLMGKSAQRSQGVDLRRAGSTVGSSSLRCR